MSPIFCPVCRHTVGSNIDSLWISSKHNGHKISQFGVLWPNFVICRFYVWFHSHSQLSVLLIQFTTNDNLAIKYWLSVVLNFIARIHINVHIHSRINQYCSNQLLQVNLFSSASFCLALQRRNTIDKSYHYFWCSVVMGWWWWAPARAPRQQIEPSAARVEVWKGWSDGTNGPKGEVLEVLLHLKMWNWLLEYSLGWDYWVHPANVSLLSQSFTKYRF